MATLVVGSNNDVRDGIASLVLTRDSALGSMRIFEAQAKEANQQIDRLVETYNYDRISCIMELLQSLGSIGYCARLKHLVDFANIKLVEITHPDNSCDMMYMCINCLQVLQKDTTPKYRDSYRVTEADFTAYNTFPIAAIFADNKLPSSIEAWVSKQDGLPLPLKRYHLTSHRSSNGPGLYLGTDKICD